MAKRKLSKRQVKRIIANQHRRKKRAFEDHAIGELVSESDLGPEQVGLVLSNYGSSALIESDNGNTHRCLLRQNLETLVCGDRVIYQLINEEGIVVARLERKSLLSRPESENTTKPIAANIDQIVIVAAIKPKLSKALIDRYLVIEETTGIPAIIVMNKIDLLDEAALLQLQQHMRIYDDIGYQIAYVSTKTNQGSENLITLLQGKSNILVGQSGVGKSSLAQKLLPTLDIRVGQLNESNLGKHTTTTSMLYHLPFGGVLIDTPGVRDFGLWHIEREQIDRGFIEFRGFLGACKFSNCQHRSEPGCAILQALEENRISKQRFESYQAIVQSLTKKS